MTGLQGRRKSRVRYEQWIDQFSARVARWGADRRAYEAASSEPWSPAGSRAESIRLADRVEAIVAEFRRVFPTIKKTPDVPTIALEGENSIRATVRSMLVSEGVDPANPSRSELGPAIEGRAGYMHPFDPALLTFDLRSTIVHDEPLKKYWFEKYGTDSECVVRRALRSLWERRKASVQSMSDKLALKHFDEELSSLVPCPAEMERRMAERGWVVPKTIDDLVTACSAMWTGLTDRARAVEGIPPISKLPPEAVASFWAPEKEDIESWVVAFGKGLPTIVDGPAGEAALEQLGEQLEGTPDATLEQLGGQLGGAADSIISLVERLLLKQDGAAGAPPAPTAPTFDPAPPLGLGEETEIDFDELLLQERKGKNADRASRMLATRARKDEESLAAAKQLVAEAKFSYDVTALDFQTFVIACDSPRELLIIGDPNGAAGYKLTFLRRVLKTIFSRRPSLQWNRQKLRLEFRYFAQSGGVAGLNLRSLLSGEMARAESFLQIDLSPKVQPNPPWPAWYDDRPWAPRWPGYPLVESREEIDLLRALPWPTDADVGLMGPCLTAQCMQQYARWKRNGLAPGELPRGWTPGNVSDRWRGAAHPVDLVFASLRST